MKLVLHFFNLLLVLAFTVACKKVADGTAPTTPTNPAIPAADANIVISGKTATAFTLTWPAATDDATAVADLQYKVVYSLANNLTDATTAQANGTVALNWTANALTTTISSLVNSTTYYAAVLVKDIDGNVGFAGTYTATLCTGKRIFLASTSSGNFGGKTGADALCAAQKPSGVVTAKAMISDNNGINTSTGLPSNSNGRQDCWGDCRSANLYTLDWVIAAGQRYCTSDYSKKVGDAGATYPVLNVPDPNVLSSTPITLYTGFNIYYGNSTTNCSNWTSTSGQFVGGTTAGVFGGTTSSFITGATGFPNCTTAASLVCVEQ